MLPQGRQVRQYITSSLSPVETMEQGRWEEGVQFFLLVFGRSRMGIAKKGFLLLSHPSLLAKEIVFSQTSSYRLLVVLGGDSENPVWDVCKVVRKPGGLLPCVPSAPRVLGCSSSFCLSELSYACCLLHPVCF